MAKERSHTYAEEALDILEASGHPMSPRELIDEAIRRDLLTPTWDRPEGSLESSLTTYIRNNPTARLVRLCEQGPTRARRGSVRFAIRDWQSTHQVVTAEAGN